MVEELELPWPSRALHPNQRVHWAERAKATREARAYTHWLAREAWGSCVIPEGKLVLRMDFYPPDHRRRDDDGLIASMKSARDGIADALKIDDRRFITRAEVKDETHPFGRVMVSIEGIK